VIAYRARFTPADEGGLVIDFPDLGGYSQGDDEEDARSMALDLLRTILQDRMRRDEPIPPARKYRGPHYRDIALPIAESAKVELYSAMLAKNLSKGSLARQLRLAKREIEQLFALSHPTSMDRIEAAYATLNLRLELTIRPAA
jgi:antitoxin HicB